MIERGLERGWGGSPEHPSSRLQAAAQGPEAEKAILSTADWPGSWAARACLGAPHAHVGCMLTRARRLGHSDSWLFRATVAVACGHSQVLQYLKWFHNTRGENAEIGMQGNPRGEAAYTEVGRPLGHWCLVCPPDPGWSLLPGPAWRSLGPQRGIALPHGAAWPRAAGLGGGGPILGTFHG